MRRTGPSSMPPASLPSGAASRYCSGMRRPTAKSTKQSTKRRARAKAARGPVSAMRLPADLTDAVDRWAAANGADSRASAIRRLLEIGLGYPAGGAGPSPGAASKATEMAGRQIDKLADASASDEEQARRKRRLTKGPKEFWDMRTDLPKPKA